MASDPRSDADRPLERGSAQPRIQVQGSGSLSHDPRCTTLTWASMVTDADAKGEDVPESVRTLAKANPDSGIAKCHHGCPILQRSIERGRELAERYGW